MERPATLLHIEAAASGRSRCGVCKERIPQGSDRIGTQRKYPFRGFLCTTWHHRQCFELPWALGLDEAIQPVTPEAKKAFTKATRLVVAPGIRELREDALKGNPKCPITGDELDSSNSHVHHYGPYDFDNIVMSFVSNFVCRCTGFPILRRSFQTMSLQPHSRRFTMLTSGTCLFTRVRIREY